MRNRTTTVLDTHPVLLDTILPGHSVIEDFTEGEQEMRRILDTHPEPLFLVFDIRELRMSFDDLLAATSMSSRGQSPIFLHPRIRGLYFITDSAIMRLAATGLSNPAFGGIKARVFGTLEEALADVEQVLATA